MSVVPDGSAHGLAFVIVGVVVVVADLSTVMHPWNAKLRDFAHGARGWWSDRVWWMGETRCRMMHANRQAHRAFGTVMREGPGPCFVRCECGRARVCREHRQSGRPPQWQRSRHDVAHMQPPWIPRGEREG